MGMVLLERLGVPQVHVARIALERADVRVELRGDERSGLLGAVGASDSATELWVDEAQLDVARNVLEQLRETVAVGEVTCASCGAENPANFDVCWKCQANVATGVPAPVENAPPPPKSFSWAPLVPGLMTLLLLSNVVLGVLLYRTSQVPRYLESPNARYENDGPSCIMEWIRSRPRTRFCDVNGDRNFERSETYDTRRTLITLSFDSNEDGTTERVDEFFVDGGLLRRMVDDDGDGRFDEVREFIAGATYVYRDEDHDGFLEAVRVEGADGSVRTQRQTSSGWE